MKKYIFFVATLVAVMLGMTGCSDRADLLEKMLFLSPKYHWTEFFTGIDLSE